MNVNWSEIVPLIPPSWRPIGHPYPTPLGAYFAVNILVVGSIRANVVVEYLSDGPGIRAIPNVPMQTWTNEEARDFAEDLAQWDWDNLEQVEAVEQGYYEPDPPEHTDRMVEDW